MPFQRGDLEALYVRLERPLYNVVYRWLWNADEAADVVQETFVKVWQARERIRPDTVEAYVYRVGMNLASNRRRRQRVWRWVGLDEQPTEHGEDSHVRSAQRDAIRNAIDSLPDKLRRVIALTELAELSYQEVAQILQIPEGTVGSRRNAALRKLETMLGDYREEVMG